MMKLKQTFAFSLAVITSSGMMRSPEKSEVCCIFSSFSVAIIMIV
ncbi:hypothetical protein [Vibrio aerogenes]|nr:hypothetical protein [Vibrio aerogenes]